MRVYISTGLHVHHSIQTYVNVKEINSLQCLCQIFTSYIAKLKSIKQTLYAFYRSQALVRIGFHHLWELFLDTPCNALELQNQFALVME